MTISTFDELKTAIQSWMLERSDLSAQVELFIELAEHDMQKKLRTWQMEGRATIASTDFTSGRASLPTDFLKSRFLHPTSTPGRKLIKVSPDALLDIHPTPHAGLAKHYSIQGDGAATPGLEIDVRPYPTNDLTLGYYKKIPALSVSQTTNWVLTEDPYCYLTGSLKYAAGWIRWGDDELKFASEFVGRMDLLNAVDQDARWGNYSSSHQGTVRP